VFSTAAMKVAIMQAARTTVLRSMGTNKVLFGGRPFVTVSILRLRAPYIQYWSRRVESGRTKLRSRKSA
jgi:hypothetical protein